jgi:hypothetical protein
MFLRATTYLFGKVIYNSTTNIKILVRIERIKVKGKLVKMELEKLLSCIDVSIQKKRKQNCNA